MTINLLTVTGSILSIASVFPRNNIILVVDMCFDWCKFPLITVGLLVVDMRFDWCKFP